MANTFVVEFRGISGSNVFTSFEAKVDNPVNRTVYVYFWHAEGTPSFTAIETAGNAFFSRQTIAANGSGTYRFNIQNLDPNETYSYQYTVTDQPTFNAADVILRRPLSPPGTYTSASKPIFTDSTIASPAIQGVPYSDGVSATFANSFSLASGSLPPGISLNSNNGAISGTPSASGTYSFVVSANGTFGNTTTSLSLTVNPPAPVFTDQTISTPAFKDAPYSDGVQASNATAYAITSGVLPTGISLNTSTGAITGTPTVEETQNFTIQASNSSGTVSTGLSLEIISGLAPPEFIDETLSNDLRVFIAYTDGVTASNDPTFSISAGTFVPGLTLNSSTGAVTGTPTAQGEYSFTIQATNAAGSDTAPFTLNIKPGLRRFDGSNFVPVTIFKRWNGSEFVDVTFAKRFDGSNFENMDG